MNKTILIYLHNSEQANWVVLEGNQITQSITRGDLSQFPDAKNAEVYVIVPAEDVLLTTAQLPKLSRQRLLQALPFALEEQLIDDVTGLHFAIDDYQSDASLPVAIVAQRRMQAWIDLCVQHGFTPSALIPAQFILPFTEREWHINCFNNHCIVRTSKFTGFACEQVNLEILLEAKLAELPDKESIKLIHTEFSEQQLLEKIASEITSFSFINLLQSTYHPKPQASKIKKIWLTACYLAIAWMGLAFFGNLGSYFILQHQANKVEMAINQIYKQNFPQAKSISAPRERMIEKLHALSGQSSKNNFLALLGQLGESLKKNPDIHIQTFDFREQQLTLEISAATFDNLDTFSQNLTQHGLSVKQQNAAEAGSQVKATLLIRAGVA